MNKSSIRIVFAGEARVGKTSMIKNSIEEDNGEERRGEDESLLQPIIVQNENFFHNKNLILVDTSAKREKAEQTARDFRMADSIVLVYDLSNPETIPPLHNYWLPLIESANPRAPVILIGNKLDLIAGDEDIHVRTKIKRVVPMLFNDFKQVEFGIEVSVKENISVKEALYSAQSIVVYPVTQLTDKATKVLTPNFKKAILRIFRLLDSDGDGYLSDKNIRDLQKSVFKIEMTDAQLKNIKDIISDELDVNSFARGINLQGFEVIFKRILSMIKIKNCWVDLSVHPFALWLRYRSQTQHRRT